ncbi:MAG: tetratricopeptide repeat protein, partial [Vicinamibacterales bacterium]
MGRKSRRPVGPPAKSERTVALARGDDTADRVPALAAVCVLLLVGAVIYLNGLNTPFLLDDVPSIVQNPYIRDLWPPWHLVNAPENTIATARPLVSLSLAVNYATSGLDVRAYRLTNIAIHLMAAIALFGVVRRTLLAGALRARFGAHASGIAFAGALLWMTHPLQTEAVNYISQRTETMMGLFYFLTLYCAIRAHSESPGSRAWFAGAMCACAAGMASKQVMVTAPIMVVLWDWAFAGEPFRVVLARRWRLYAGLAATWLLLAALSLTFRDTNAGMGVTPFDYALSQCKVILQYLRRAIWPTGLIFDYGLARPTSVSEVAPYAALLVLLLGLTLVALIRHRAAGFLGMWIFLILAPTSSVLPLFTEVGAERRMYVPLAGVVMLVVGGLYLLAARIGESSGAPASAPLGTVKSRGLAILVLFVVGTFCWLTVQRNRQYLDSLALWTSVVAEAPENYRGRNNLGVALQQAGREAEAIEEFRVALQQNPDFGPAHHNLGKSLHEAGNFAEAIEHYEAALRVDGPGQLHADLGAALEAVGRASEATGHYEIALELDPSDVEAHLNVGRSYFARQQPEEAISHYREALRLQPSDVR